jgi:hypothetical protein
MDQTTTRRSKGGSVPLLHWAALVLCAGLLLGAVEVRAGIFEYNDGLNDNSRILERVAMWSVHDSPVGSTDPYAMFNRTCAPTSPPPPIPCIYFCQTHH